MKVFVSNQLPLLAEALCQKLFEGRVSPFEKQWVITPSDAVKSDLYRRWLDKIEVVAGIKTMTYKELLRKMFPEIPSRMELALRLENSLESIPELDDYLKEGAHLRKLDFCDALSSLFLKYLQRPELELLKWREQEGWQQKLWKNIFGDTLPISEVKPLQGSFFFYHISHVAPYQWAAFSQMETSWFLFSPSEMYLGDFQTERQQRYLLKKAQGTVKEELAQFFQQDSSLLSNWGKQGRELLTLFEDMETIELFKAPEKPCALHHLQREWLTLEKITSTPDLSIQLHSAPSMLREVEVIWEIIQRLPFLPREILVAAPDIQAYAAAIQWVFEERGGPFDYLITDLEAKTCSPLLQGLETLLSLPKYRFSKEVFEKLLLSLPFLSRFNLNLEEAETISEWMTEFHLRYDMTGHPGSWQAALHRVMEAVVLSTTSALDFSDAPLINRWIEITLKMQKALTPLSDQKKRSGEAWADLIEEWLETFFISAEETDLLSSLMSTLRNEKVEGLFPYATIERALQSVLTKPSSSLHHSRLQAVRFTSLKQGTVAAAKAILCMGMQEGAFPRFDPPSSLPSLPITTACDEDKALFLEVVSHAQEMLILTYLRCHPDDGKEVLPSTVIQELIKDRGSITTVHHPFSSLDSFYYSKEGFESFSHLPYEMLQIQKIPCLNQVINPSSTSLKKIIDVRLLKKLARHPVQFYLEEGLGLRFPWNDRESEFLFSPAELNRLRFLSLKLSIGEIIDQLLKEGKLPTGSFQSAALQVIEQELTLYQAAIDKMGIDRSSIFSLELSPYCKTVLQIAPDRFIAPALKLTLPSGESTMIQGVVDHVTPQGILHHADDSLEDLLKIWPLFCLVQSTIGLTSIFLTKKESMKTICLENPHDTLTRYVDYLHKSLQTPSPLLPAWGRRLFKGDDLPATTTDAILLWAEQRELLPSSQEWANEWRSYLQKVVHELL